MNLKDMLAKITQLSEATKETPTGKVHKAEPGGYGRKFDTDEEGEEKKKEAPAVKRGRGRPKKGADETGEVKKYDWSQFGVKSGKDVKLPKWDKSKTTKHSLKEYFEELDAKVVNEMGMQKPIPVVSKQGDTQQTGAGFIHIDDTSPAGKAMQQALGDLAQQKKAQIVVPTTQQTSKPGQPTQGVTGQAPVGTQPVSEKWGTDTKVSPEEKGKYAGKGKAELLKAYNALKKSGPHKKGSPEFGKMRELAFAIRAKSDWGKVAEGDLPPQDGLLGAGLGAGRDQGVNEGKKPDFLDLDKDGNKKESMKKAASDAKKDKKKVDEGIMDKIKSFAVPKLMNMLGADKAAEIANTVKQVTGGDFTPSKENAIKVAKAFGFDKMQPPGGKGQEQQMAEGIAGNWQGKLIQLMYSLGLLGTAAGAATFWGTVGGTWLAAVGALILTFAGTFFSSEKGMVGAMGREGRKGTDTGVTDFSEQQSKKDKKKVEEGMEHRLKAARHAGKAHALAKEAYNCRYDDMEEAKCYHEGYKEGLDECYGVMPVQGLVVGEESPAATVPGMADQAMDEGNAFTAALAKTPKGGKFSVGGKTFTDRTNYDAKVDEMAFESWDNQLNALLESKEEVAEGMTVSISKGQQGAPDSVSVSAQDAEADQLLGLIKSAGLGLFGGEEHSGYGAPSGEVSAPGGIDVVDDNDGMMALIKKVTGAEVPSSDYADEEGSEDHAHEEVCEVCHEAECQCDDNKEMVDEVESEDQMTYQVAEESPQEAGQEEEAETAADEDAEAKEDEAAAEYDQSEKEVTVNESVKLDEWANEAGKRGTDAAFEADIDFMMNVISSGLNKRKSTGQTTVPVIAGQTDRMKAQETTDINESVDDIVADWKKLAGLK